MTNNGIKFGVSPTPSSRRRLRTGVVSGGGSSGLLWNPLDKSGGIVLSDADATATSTLVAGGVRSVTGHADGKWYVELTTGTFNGNIFDSDGLGVTTADVNLFSLPGAPTTFWVRNDGLMFVGAVSLGIGIDAIKNAVIGFAIDLNAKLMWCQNSFNGPDWVGATFSPADPVTGLNGIDVSGLFSFGVFVFPCMSTDSSTTDVCTCNQVLINPPPVGFLAW